MSLRQAGYIVIGALAGLLVAFLIPGALVAKATAFSVPLMIAVVFSFVKYKDLDLDRLLILYITYRRAGNQFRYERRHRAW